MVLFPIADDAAKNIEKVNKKSIYFTCTYAKIKLPNNDPGYSAENIDQFQKHIHRRLQ